MKFKMSLIRQGMQKVNFTLKNFLRKMPSEKQEGKKELERARTK